MKTIVVEGDTIVTEHVEHWAWPTGEKISFPFVSMHEIRDGKLVRWWDYWDLSTLMNAAPAWWVEHIMTESANVGLRDPDSRPNRRGVAAIGGVVTPVPVYFGWNLTAPSRRMTSPLR